MQTDQSARHTSGLLIIPPIIYKHIETSPYRPGHNDPDIHLAFVTNEHPLDGPVARRDATAIAPRDDTARPTGDLAKQLQDIVDSFPSRQFAGHIQAHPEHGTPWRYTVDRATRLVEIVHPAVQLVWPGQNLTVMGGTKGPSQLVRKLIAHLQQHPGTWFYGAQLGRELGTSAPSTTNALTRLKERGLVRDDWDHMPVQRGFTRRHLYTITEAGLAWRAP